MSKLPAETAAERTARHVAHCKRLAELGLMLARGAAKRAGQALAAPPSEPGNEDAPADSDPVVLFTQLAGSVRRSIMLERRLVAGHAAAGAPLTQADPRRARIRLALCRAAGDRIDRDELCEEAEEMLDEELALDPDGASSLPDLLADICEDLGFEVDYEKLAADLGARDVPDPVGEPEEPGWPVATKPSGTPH